MKMRLLKQDEGLTTETEAWVRVRLAQAILDGDDLRTERDRWSVHIDSQTVDPDGFFAVEVLRGGEILRKFVAPQAAETAAEAAEKAIDEGFARPEDDE